MKKDDVISKVEISRQSGDPNYMQEFAIDPRRESMAFFKSALYR